MLSCCFDGVISEKACPAASSTDSPYCTSTNAWRMRNPALELVIAKLPGADPLKSISK